ncbi:phosphotransferase [Deinococcus peraridilitoris]|uniref:phosphotransferase n=1 Tax=Deinococcus peraridilitoris TaxID=432329 RepID=UPI001FDF722B|nr:phosphotransferase [Deinococcus peraridilitoris]
MNSDTAEITEWTVRTIYGGAGGGSIYRYVGQAQDRGTTHPWSLIQKIVRASPDCTDPLTPRYWEREPLAYQSELFARLPAGLAAPRCYHIETAGHEYRLWLEDIQESTSEWTLEHYGRVARELGRFNAAYLTSPPVPSWPWMSRSFLRHWIELCATTAREVRQFPDHPHVQLLGQPNAINRLLALWDDREVFLGALERLPQTLCHLDVFRRNLLRRMTNGQEQTVLLDWAFTGTGALGEEIAPLVTGTVMFFGLEADKLRKLDAVVFEEYLAGLHEAGWRGDPQEVRFAYAATSALRYTFPPVSVLDEQFIPVVESIFGRPFAEVTAHHAETRSFLAERADEARALMDKLKL